MRSVLGPTDFVIERVILDADIVILDVSGAAGTARCPACGATCGHVHACYRRRPVDLPWRGARVRLVVTVRRFVCENRACARVTFAEDFGAALPRGTRRTAAVTAYLTLLARAAGGEGGARLAREAGVPTSPDTLLRLQRSAVPAAEAGATPRVLGVDDLALRRGHSYATLLVNMETHTPIDLLQGREAAVLADWLREHPGVEIVVRDRAGAYAEGARAGAPDALQVADRFHLLQNATAAMDGLLRTRKRTEEIGEGDPSGEDAAPAANVVAASLPIPAPSDLAPARPLSPTAAQQQAQRAARIARWQAAQTRRAAGESISQIARDLKIERKTVRSLLAAPEPPRNRAQLGGDDLEQHPSGLASPTLQPYVGYLQNRWQAGCTNVCQLYRELVARGYTGSRTLLSTALQPWRAQQRATRPPRKLSRREIRWLCLRSPERLSPKEQATVRRVLDADPELATGYDLLHRFHAVIMGGDPRALDGWLADARRSGLPTYVGLANGIQSDRAAVDAALTTPWSTGPVEGHVHRVKLVKRLGYGRAGFDLLRRRVLAA